MAKGDLDNAEVFVSMDNSTAESSFFKGSSTSRRLFALVLWMQLLEMGGLLRICVLHVAGTRMISQVTDGLSRGLFSGGVLAGKSMLSFVPLRFSATDRSRSIIPWVISWTGQKDLIN
jgi:hypothetical protein